MDFYNAKKFVINLDRRPDRWLEFEHQAKMCGLINYERFPAIDGKLISYDQTAPLPTGKYHLTLPINQREQIAMSQSACRKSHLKCIEMAKEQNLPYVVIIEDDADFDPQIISKWQMNGFALPEDWQQMYFGAHHFRQPEMITKHIGKCVTALSTICYAVNSNSYDLFSEALQKHEVLDIIYCNYLHTQLKIKAYCYMPNLVVQRKGFSDIEAMNINYSHYYNRWA